MGMDILIYFDASGSFSLLYKRKADGLFMALICLD
jgi:hypothetical protein